MAALPQLMTVEQFRQLPGDGEYQYELHHGEVVAMTHPKHRHINLQLRLSGLLSARLAAFGSGAVELPYRAFAEFDLHVADVAAVSRARWEAVDPDDNLRGAPDLVIEVKSPSNTARQLSELAAVCLGNGALELWIVDGYRKSVTVRRDGVPAVSESGTSLSLAGFGAGELAVDEIFA
jgi:Uma2 family endonuclease